MGLVVHQALSSCTSLYAALHHLHTSRNGLTYRSCIGLHQRCWCSDHLCCVVLCCPVLRFAVLCCLCCAVLCYAMLLRQVCGTKKVNRYHPAEVKEGMAALARAQEHLQTACGAAWTQLLQDFTAARHSAFREAVAAMAQLDALHSLAVVASKQGYCRPQVIAT